MFFKSPLEKEMSRLSPDVKYISKKRITPPPPQKMSQHFSDAAKWCVGSEKFDVRSNESDES